MRITILTDNINSWFIPFGNELRDILNNKGHDVEYITNKRDIKIGDVCFLLSCSNIVNEEFLTRNEKNIVVHASDLPKGKGFAPVQWQILEGKNEIVLTLFEAVKEVDAGPYYFKNRIEFDGTELYSEIREMLGLKIIEMCIDFIDNIESYKPIQQFGKSTYYRKRTTKDDELDINKTIIEQFNHFRVADNDKYPLWFEFNGIKYKLKIEKSNNES